ncbi:Hypothetical predicted protein [Mytilus galloprovincialis]|uniref:Uncharacterized protein n=1 Tax=Mytilus galloprovincialis TaxID=29158 RepID=A0A8B6F6P3_MYTGA|nr:Hypothetical predicted protein [Mytilus galloprovincialis]
MYRRSGRKRVPTSRANNGGAAAAAKKSKQQQEEATANIADRLPRTSGTPPVQLGSNTVTTNVLPPQSNNDPSNTASRNNLPCSSGVHPVIYCTNSKVTNSNNPQSPGIVQRLVRPGSSPQKTASNFQPLHLGKCKITQDSVLLEHLWDKGKTPVKIKSLRELLSNYENKTDAAMLLLGFIEGFRLNYTGPRISSFASNLISAEVHKTETNLKLQKEVHLGRMLGPFSKIPISTLRISPIGVVSKNDGGWRLITHLSYPLNWSVNDFIDPEICKGQHIEGEHNAIADALSRFQEQRFMDLVPNADSSPAAIPQEFLSMISELK